MAESLRDLVVSLSLNTKNFTRNIKSVGKQIQEAESKFRLAAAGIEGFEKTAAGLSTQLSTLERRLSLQKDAVTRDRQQKEVRIRAARTKADFDALKKDYDVEFKRDSEKLASLRATAEKEARKVDPNLLLRYRQIKQHVSPPMAKLVGNQCGGCFMTLPSASLKKIVGEDAVVECDNCGRILYAPEGE